MSKPSGEPVRVCGGNGYAAIFDDMTWPRADNSTGNIEYAIRHGPNPSRSDVMIAASTMAAYRELVWCPRSKREAVVRRLREAALAFPVDES